MLVLWDDNIDIRMLKLYRSTPKQLLGYREECYLREVYDSNLFKITIYITKIFEQPLVASDLYSVRNGHLQNAHG